MKYEHKKFNCEEDFGESFLYENGKLHEFFQDRKLEDAGKLHKWFRDRDSELADEGRLIDTHL